MSHGYEADPLIFFWRVGWWLRRGEGRGERKRGGKENKKMWGKKFYSSTRRLPPTFSWKRSTPLLHHSFFSALFIQREKGKRRKGEKEIR
jgi:hypothetical protein